MSLLTNHWFDFVVLAILVVGFKTAQHKQALPKLFSACQWLVALVICLFLYKAPALWIAKKWSMQPDVIALTIFPLELLVVFFLLGFVRVRLTKNLVGKELVNENWEPRLTKVAGSLRFLVFLLIGMAWIHGRYVTEKDLQDHAAFCKENFGNISYPVLCTINNDMFNGSYSGKFARKYLDAVLMKPLPRNQYAEAPMVAGKPRDGQVQLREMENDFDPRGNQNGGGKEKDAVEGKDGNDEGGGADKSSTGSSQIVYHEITLRGISGSGDRLFALINDQTFRAGELSTIRYEDRKLTVQCMQISDNSAIVRLEDGPNPIQLKLGVATNLKGEPIAKN